MVQGFRVESLPTPSSDTCTAAGAIFFDSAKKQFYGCDGEKWRALQTAGGQGTSCKTIKDANAGASSATYTIDPDGGGPIPPLAVYCDMQTDGGGWTLVMALRQDVSNTWHLYDYESAGTNVDGLSTQPGAPSVNGALPKAFVNALGQGGQRQYLVDIQRGLFRMTMNDQNMDWFRGIYESGYSNPRVSTIVEKWDIHVPQASAIAWGNTDNGMLTRSPCPGDQCHYIPDDVSGGGEWAHRHNVTPAAGANSSAHYSKVFMR